MLHVKFQNISNIESSVVVPFYFYTYFCVFNLMHAEYIVNVVHRKCSSCVEAIKVLQFSRLDGIRRLSCNTVAFFLWFSRNSQGTKHYNEM